MTRFTDGKKTVAIEMKSIHYNYGFSPSFEADFFEIGGLKFDEEKNAYVVRDVDYLIEQAFDWKHALAEYPIDELTPYEILTSRVLYVGYEEVENNGTDE